MERRWRESSPDSDSMGSMRSYCEVLRNGSPPVDSLEEAPPSPSHAQGARRLASVVIPAESAAVVGHPEADGEGWMRAPRPRKRRRNLAPLLAMVVRPELADLAGRCFNCLGNDHVAALCPNSTRCLRCGGEGHVARLCRSRRRPSWGSSPTAVGQVLVATRLGPRVTGAGAGPAAAAHPKPGPALLARLGLRVLPPPPLADVPVAVPPPSVTVQLALVEAVEAMPLGAASLRPRVQLCIIPRSAEVDAAEVALQWSTVVSVTGTRPHLALAVVGRVIAARFPEFEGSFTTHRFWPDDFLVVFNSRGARDAVLTAGSINGRRFSLRFSAWNRFRKAVGRTAFFRTHLEIEGVPPHAWNSGTAATLLGPACAVERDEEDDDLLVPPEMMVQSEVSLLEYRVIVHLLRVEDTTASTDRPSSDDWPSDDGDRGRNGGPGRGYGDRRPAQGTRQNFFSCSRGHVDEDDLGDHSGGFRRRATGGGADGWRVGLSAAVAEFRPMRPCRVLSPDPTLDWCVPSLTATDDWDPMRLEATSLSPSSRSSAPAPSLDLSPVDFQAVAFPSPPPSAAATVEQSMLSMFTVSLSGEASPVVESAEALPSAGSSSTPVEDLVVAVVLEVEAFSARVWQRRLRRKVVQHHSPRRSKRIPGRKATPRGAPRQQRALMHRMGVAREGDRIGDEALQAYIKLFERPLSAEHMTTILSLFGWENVALPLEEGIEVEVSG
ncbi:hypothetical protein BRADI_3g30156v3 [Brachypodium distachyon]|uniref:CCHC-type domain-containing protein n=1 Tax=Brachypodium distachyon TaxID=15368 RepID=A0A0Q3Q6P6_BRADI|nr:hypothetical protein BRADI_3g30156v3 [Brachypodium distachyon]